LIYDIMSCNYCSVCVEKCMYWRSEKRTITRDPREHLLESMRAKLNTEEVQNSVSENECLTVEPVFGQMKQDRGFREFLLRGKRKQELNLL